MNMINKKQNSAQCLFLAGWLVLLIGFLLWPAVVAAVPERNDASINIDDTLDTKYFGEKVWILEDKDKSYTIADVTGPDVEWTRSTDKAINKGFSSSAYWFRFTAVNTLNHDMDWYLTIPYPLLDDIQVFVPQPDGRYRIIEAGSQYPFSDREIIDREFVFLLNQPPGSGTYLVRIATSTSLIFEPIMKSHQGYQAKIHHVYPFFWIYYGAMIIMIVYNLFLFFLVREKSYLHLVAFIVSFTLFQFTLNGFAFQYLWPHAVWWAKNSLPLFICLAMAFITLFLRSFLNISELYADSLVDKTTKYVIIAPALIWGLGSLPLSYAVSIQVAILVVVISILSLAGSMGASIGYTRNTRFVVISCTVLFFGVLLYAFKALGIMPANLVTNWAVQVGSVMFVALLSVGLADRITMLKNELLATNANISLMLESISQETADMESGASAYREEEIGQILSMRFDTFMDKFRLLIGDVSDNTKTLKAASEGLLELSRAMAAESGEMSRNAGTVASESEEMSARMTAISSTMEQTSQNVTLIASSVEEMTTTVDEITNNTEVARSTTANAVSHAGDVSRKLDNLNAAAEDIGSVTGMITEISKKTNLLALNATIEAARAGEAGRGFAVVANEIKELAQQTAGATQQINKQIEDNKQVTSEAVKEIGRIVDVISSVDEIVSTIASSIDQQSASTREVASNVSQISQGISEVTRSVSECSTASNNVSREVAAVSQSTEHMTASSQQLRTSADDLRKMAEFLNELMQRFKV